MKQNLSVIGKKYNRNKGEVENIYTPDSAIHSWLAVETTGSTLLIEGYIYYVIIL